MKRPRWPLAQIGMCLSVLPLLAGCVSAPKIVKDFPYKQIPVSEPQLPKEAGPDTAIVSALECLAQSKVLNNMKFAVAVHADGTGKTVTGADGGTGSVLPQGTSAIWASQAVMLAGGIAQNFYELNTERALRQFGGSEMEKDLVDRSISEQPDFVVSTAFTALDFLGGPDLDVRFAGLGPQFQARGAALEVSAEIYRPGDRVTLAISSLSRQVMYNFAGYNAAHSIAPLQGALLTGAVSWTDQQRIQEATRDMIALSVADVLTLVPGTPTMCRVKVEKLLKETPKLDIPEGQPVAASPKVERSRVR